MFKAITPYIGKFQDEAINVSSYGQSPFNVFSPFTYSESIQIPVPGEKSVYSQSVEGVWQGLKIIDNVIDPTLFSGRPKKRKGEVLGHKFGEEVLNIISARKTIYVPSYEYYVEFHIKDSLKEDLLLRGVQEEIRFYDVESNLNIQNPRSPLSHAAVLANYFNKLLERRLEQTRQELDRLYELDEVPPEDLSEPIARATNFYLKSGPLQRALISHLLSSISKKDHTFKKRYYERLEEKLL